MNATVGDLCCCAGLAADGYASIFGAANVHGYDVEPQPDYPYAFDQLNVMRLLAAPDHRSNPLHRHRALHTSFPCQALTRASTLRTAQGGKSKYPDLLTPGLALLREHWSHVPWIAENVDGPAVRAIMAPRKGEHLLTLCGSMFGLQVQRHRLFLANFPLTRPEPTPNPPGVKSRSIFREQGCRHDTFPLDPRSGKPRPWGVWHTKGDQVPDGGRTALTAEHGRQVMGSHRSLPWDKLKEGFPPAYTSWVGADLRAELSLR